MNLPHGDKAIVDLRKLLEYCLNPRHPRGRNKARVFASVGIQDSNAAELQTALLTAARMGEARLGDASLHGQRYIVDFDWVLPSRTVRIRSSWIVRNGEELPRLTSC